MARFWYNIDKDIYQLFLLTTLYLPPILHNFQYYFLKVLDETYYDSFINLLVIYNCFIYLAKLV